MAETVTADVDLDSDGIIDLTTEAGVYSFADPEVIGMLEGSYTVVEVAQGDYQQTAPGDAGHELVLVAGEIAERALAAGKLAGIFCLNADKVEEAYNQGFRLMSHGVDTLFLDHSARPALKEVAWLAEQGTGPAAGY